MSVYCTMYQTFSIECELRFEVQEISFSHAKIHYHYPLVMLIVREKCDNQLNKWEAVNTVFSKISQMP